MPGLVRPRSFPIRKITDLAQRLGKILNPLRMPDHGGFTSLQKWGSNAEFKVEPPSKIRTGESAARGKE